MGQNAIKNDLFPLLKLAFPLILTGMVKLAEPYLHALTWGLLPTFIFAALDQFIIGLGHGRLVMIFTTFSVLFALFFSFALIFGKFAMPALGISGAGWGMSLVTAKIGGTHYSDIIFPDFCSRSTNPSKMTYNFRMGN